VLIEPVRRSHSERARERSVAVSVSRRIGECVAVQKRGGVGSEQVAAAPVAIDAHIARKGAIEHRLARSGVGKVATSRDRTQRESGEAPGDGGNAPPPRQGGGGRVRNRFAEGQFIYG